MDSEVERWLVRAEGHGEPRVAWVLRDEDRSRLEMAVEETRPWIGFLHSRVSQVFESVWIGEALTFVVEDDRGPRFVDAAARLSEPAEREGWSVAQVIAIGDGLATMRQRARDFVHRRLEPGYVFVDAGGHARLSPPIATVSQGQRPSYMGRGRVVRSMAWLSPEQCRGMVVTPASDVFVLAVHLVAALTGRNPFRRETDFGTLEAIVREEAPAVEVRAPGLAAVIARGLEKKPAQRYPDPGTFAGELWRCVPDAVEIDECVSDRIAAWWPSANRRDGEGMGERCKMAWEQLAPTGRDEVRHCESCGQDVVRVSRLAAIVPLAGRHCVSYRGGD